MYGFAVVFFFDASTDEIDSGTVQSIPCCVDRMILNPFAMAICWLNCDVLEVQM